MVIKVGEDGYEESLSYTELCDIIEQQHEDELNNSKRHWVFKEILEHQGPLEPSDPEYNDSPWNVKILWDDGTTSVEPLNSVAKDNPVSYAKYAKENDLLNTEGWKRFKQIANREKKMHHMAKHVQAYHCQHGPVYMFGVEVPKSAKHALELDRINNNNLWELAQMKEMDHLDEYFTFEDLGHSAKLPEGYSKVRLHVIFSVKHDGHKIFRCVADGHLTAPVSKSSYSGVVS
jgi:hypothetical protein